MNTEYDPLTILRALVRLEDYQGERESNYQEARSMWLERARFVTNAAPQMPLVAVARKSGSSASRR